jgi:uncharacterized protein (TIGR03067 family)
MKHLTLLVLVLVCGVCFVLARENVSDLDRMQGLWQVVSLTEKGKPVLPKEFDLLEVTISKDEFTVRDMSKVLVKYGIKLDPAQKPGAIDFTAFIEGKRGEKGKLVTELGIYVFENDLLKLSIAEDGKKRPAVFAGKGTEGCSIMVLKRKKSDEEAK